MVDGRYLWVTASAAKYKMQTAKLIETSVRGKCVIIHQQIQ